MHPKGTSNPNVSIRQRLTEFPGENFKESAGTLFCTGCREEVGLMKTIIQQHIKSSKHSRGKERLAVKESREQDIANVLIAYDNENHPKGEMQRMAQRVYRFKVVCTFLKAGFAINKINLERFLKNKAIRCHTAQISRVAGSFENRACSHSGCNGTFCQGNMQSGRGWTPGTMSISTPKNCGVLYNLCLLP